MQFVEITDAVAKQTSLINFAHISAITEGEAGLQVYVRGIKKPFLIAESLDDIKKLISVASMQEVLA